MRKKKNRRNIYKKKHNSNNLTISSDKYKKNIKKNTNEPVLTTKNICPVCNKPIKDIYTTIIEKESKKLAHFDCILNIIKETEHIHNDESIIYIGSGYFAVIKKEKNDFKIIRKINYENKEIDKNDCIQF